MTNVPLSKVCVCGSPKWHLVSDHAIWCRRCGCVRFKFQSRYERYWRVPLDRAGELSAEVTVKSDDPPTLPDTPIAKKKDES